MAIARPQPGPASPHLLQRIASGYLRGYHRIHATGPCTLPGEGAALLICNHISGLDPVVLQSQCARPIVWMMAREYYDQPALKWFYKAIQAIPVDRSGRDLAATRSAMRALEAGGIVGIFPEGRIATNSHLLPFQTGVALIATRVNVPVYPAALEGSGRGKEMDEVFLYPQAIYVGFGAPVDFDRTRSDRPAIEAATALMQRDCEAVLKQCQEAAQRL